MSSNAGHNKLCKEFASQLETHGLWHWAVFVLLHIQDPGMNKKTNVTSGDVLVHLFTSFKATSLKRSVFYKLFSMYDILKLLDLSEVGIYLKKTDKLEYSPL